MSSSNLVQINYVAEAEYGKKPDSPYSAVTLETARFTSESLSGTPITTESQGLRTDRMSPGQVVTGLEVGGSIEWELASDTFFDDFFEASMMDAWVAEETINTTVSMVVDPVDDQKATLTLGAEFTNLVPGTIVELNDPTTGLVIVRVISVTTPSTVFSVAIERGQGDLGDTMDVSIPSYVDIGTTKKSFLIAKAYTDVLHDVTTDEHSQTYLGELVSGFSVNLTYGEIVTGSYTVLGNGYEQEHPAMYQQVVTDGGTVNPAGTSSPLNASIDVPIVTTDGTSTTFCIENLSIELDNGLTPQNCIGKDAPTDYTLGTAAITITASIYNSDPSYDEFMPAKLTQDPVAISVTTVNDDGGYTFDLRAVQLSFPDPAATGRDQSVMMEAAGVAKVGENGESALRIYKH